MLPRSCLLAAIDLGSNSFRLEIDRYLNGHIKRKEYLRTPVRLGRGLDQHLNLSQEAMERGWRYLQELGDHLKKVKVHQARAIATQTLRQANNRDEFLATAESLLGYPIEIVSGEKEAELIYTGVTALLDAKKRRWGVSSTEKRLVIDIGGRSTEIIVGQGSEIIAVASVPIGSVGLSVDFFSDNQLQPEHFNHAIEHAKQAFKQAYATLQEKSQAPLVWDKVYGASGTIGAISNVLRRNHISAPVITQTGLDWLYGRLIEASSIDHLNLQGLGERKDVVGGGLSNLMALFEVFQGLHNIAPAKGALRHGIIYEMTRGISAKKATATKQPYNNKK